MPRRFAALRFIGGLYRVLAYVAAVLTVLAALGIAGMGIGGPMLGEFGRAGMMGGLVGGLVGGILALLYGGFITATLFALSQLIDLLLEVHEKTSALSAAPRPSPAQ